MESQTIARNWYVAYTLPNAEKSISKTLTKMQIVSYLPMQEILRNWGGRRVKIFSPLFPNYIFVYSSYSERYEALEAKGMIKYISFSGKPAIIKDNEIEAIKKMLTWDVETYPNTIFRPGKKVKIVVGPLSGVEGIIEEINGSRRLIVTIECLNRAVSVKISQDMVASCVGSI